MLGIKDLHWNRDTGKGYANCAEFIVMLRKLGDIADFFTVLNRDKAPWHVQARFSKTLLVDVWPHKRKFQLTIDGEQTVVEGGDAWEVLDKYARMMYCRALAEGTLHDTPAL